MVACKYSVTVLPSLLPQSLESLLLQYADFVVIHALHQSYISFCFANHGPYHFHTRVCLLLFVCVYACV